MTAEGETTARVWLRAFGVAGIGAAGEEAYQGLGAKAVGMFAYLAMNGPAPMTRDALVDLLWERVSPAQGKGSLRQEIRRYKKILGDEVFAAVFEVSDNYVGLRAHAIDADVFRLEEAAASDDAEDLAAILDIYGGDFLSDNTARAAPLQEWAEERRRFYADMAISALTRLAFLDLEAGRLERCQQAADWVIGLDPLHEQAHEALIRRHIADGRRGQARSVFELFRGRMLRELGVEPNADLAALVAPNAGPAPMRATRTAAAAEKPPLIAVLNVSRPLGGEQDYLAAGMVEELVANLSRSSWLRVATLNAPFLPREGVEMAQRDLQGEADYVLRVNVQVTDQQSSIVANINRVGDAATMFSETLHDRSGDLLGLQRRTAIRIASTFEEKVIHAEGELLRDMPQEEVDEDHRRLVMRARWLFWKASRKHNAEAQRLLEQALSMRPEDASSLCLYAFAKMVDGWCDWGEGAVASFEAARQFAGRAANLAPENAWAQFALGVASSERETLDQAKQRLERARDLSPSMVAAVGDLGRIHVFQGNLEEGVRLSNQAIELSPYDQHYGLWIRAKALAHYIEGDLAAARELIDYSLIVRPGWFHNHLLRAAILSEQGEDAKAQRALAGGLEMVGGYSSTALAIGHPFEDQRLLERFADALNRAGGGFSV